MNSESNNKLETIILSVINRLYEKEANVGLDLEDLRALEIIYKIAKESRGNQPSSPLGATEMPPNLIELLRAVKGTNSNDDESK